MSYCGALPSAESESHLLVDACLARVRQDAGLDDDPVLPPLHVLIGKSKDLPPRHRLVVSPSAHNLPSAAAIVKAAAATAAAATATASSSSSSSVQIPARDRSRAETTLTPEGRAKKTFAQRLRWPVFLCGFVAGTFGGIAVMKSPVGHKPAVQSFMKSVRHHATTTYATAASKAHLHR